jgi:hypothetical protein
LLHQSPDRPILWSSGLIAAHGARRGIVAGLSKAFSDPMESENSPNFLFRRIF